MRQIELRLQSENPQFRRVWVQFSRVGSRHRIVLTLFPQNGEYRMLFGVTYEELTYDIVNEMIQKDLVESN